MQDGDFLVRQVVLFGLGIDHQHVNLVIVLEPVVNGANPAALAASLHRVAQLADAASTLDEVAPLAMSLS